MKLGKSKYELDKILVMISDWVQYFLIISKQFMFDLTILQIALDKSGISVPLLDLSFSKENNKIQESKFQFLGNW